MTREEQIEQEALNYGHNNPYCYWNDDDLYEEDYESPSQDFKAGAEWADEHPSNPYKDVIAHMSSNTYRVWKQNIWHDAQGDNLPEIDREVIVLCDDGHGGYKVCFGHRPYEYVSHEGKMTYLEAKTYGKGGWNIPDVKWWLDVELPNKEEQQ